MVREWVIFAICLGLGGHLVLGLILHAPDLWPRHEAGLYGLLVGLSLYVMVQLARSLWWLLRGKTKADTEQHGREAEPF
ncbi:MAG: hypothetical protein FJ249_01980 [Nitrospira sp.]|nr:hypothetical protein [Nitrospira sp.]